MPNSSRRKQSKPQHLPSEEEGGVAGNELNQPVTSTSASFAGAADTQEHEYGSTSTVKGEEEGGVAGNELNQPVTSTSASFSRAADTQEHKYGSTTSVTGLNLKKNGENSVENDAEIDQDTSEAPSQDLTKMRKNFTNFLPHDLKMRSNVAGNGDLVIDDDLETEDDASNGDENTKPFKSKHSLQYLQYMSHGKHPVDSDILQRYEFLRKRSLEESLLKTAGTGGSDGKVIGESSSGLDSEPHEKRQRTDDIVSQQSSSSYNSAIIAGSTTATDNGFDLRMSKPTDSGRAMSSEPDGQDLSRSCPICAKVFPKPSDLKRHMMCHTGEKPFRCEYCNKPFRAKSSMHYHLKAAHGVQIELSPGLEERYLRMKTRASLGYYQRGHLSDSGLLRMDNHMDIDEIEDDCESTDSQSYYHTSGIGSDITDTKSQGHFNNTGNDGRSALDLSVSGRTKDRVGDTMSGLYGETIIQTESPFKKSRISIHNETVLVTRLDGLDIINGQNTSIYKCYLCGKMFQSMSKLQCHLSLHFEKQVVTYECCFCEEIFQFKTQLQNHIRRQHSTPLNKSKDTNENPGHLSTSNESDNQLSCRYCRKIFNKQISLNKHMRLHFWNKNCFCRICGKSFIQYTSLQVHMSRFHWKTVGKSKSSVLRRKINFFNTYRFKPESHDGIIANQNEEPLDLIKNTDSRPMNGNLALIMPKSPLQNGDQSDAGASRHSSENNLSGYMSSSDMYDAEDGAEIKTAAKRSLMPFMRAEGSPRHKAHRKSTPNHLKPPTHVTSDNHVPLNFIKSESTHQDSNNNESVNSHGSQPSTENKTLPPSLSERLIPPGYNMNATNHLLMAKALAAHQTLSHFTNTSQPMIFPPNHLPPSLAAMTQMMQLPVTVPSLSSETVANTSQSPSPASQTSSKSDTSPEDRDFTKEGAMRDSMLGFPRVPWSQGKSAADNWTFNMFSPADPGHTDGRKVSSLSRTHSRLGIVHTPINREAVCKPTTLTDGRTVYKCPFCSKEFVSFSDINRHMDFHEDIRPYKCQYCDYYARTNSQLKVHMMRHQGIREYCCKLCNYKGVTQSDLNRHMKSQIHMLKARNACTYCGEGFVTTKNLEKHLDGNCIVKMQKLNGGLDLPLTESIA